MAEKQRIDANFWHERWAANEIAFHQSRATPALVAHVDKLGLAPGDRVFVPLSGKTLDIGWLRGQGYRVAGAELSEIAVRQLFVEMEVEPQVKEAGKLKRYRAPGLDIYVGDIFDLDAAQLGPVDAVFDRAALVALPPDVRTRYAQHLTTITGNAPQLVVTFEYDQAQMEGPPFAVLPGEIERHYAGVYQVTNLQRREMPNGFGGRVAAHQSTWLLTRK